MLLSDMLARAIGADIFEANEITATELNLAGIRNISLREYQIVGVNWLNQRIRLHRGGILADEMGLGKTCQVVSFLSIMLYYKPRSSILLVCPLSVLDNWKGELVRFFPDVNFVAYWGSQEARLDKRAEYDPSRCPILLTTYELCIIDKQFLESFDWDVAVLDEGHHLKNSASLRYEVLSQICKNVRFVLTGTPVQNDLTELYNLLHFVAPSYFPMSMREAFVEYFGASDAHKERDYELSKVIQPFILRRVKHQVALNLPPRLDILVYHSLTSLQLKIYRSLLTRNADVFTSIVAAEQSMSTSNLPSYRLNNLLMQLRKCVNHPYLFDGVEPEPFELGDHLINASGKLILLDLILKFLYNPFIKGKNCDPKVVTSTLTGPVHKVLIFSQMTRMLDIIQDYLTLKDYPYERLDGSVRGEDRLSAVQGFSHDRESFVFLLSTKAGGQGLNLVAADTVILMDSDFNPQNDLQATARSHRIGQTKPVRVIRLVGRDTIEEAILARADAKLKLTTRVLGANFAPPGTEGSSASEPGELNLVLKFGLSRLLKAADSCSTNISPVNEQPYKPHLRFDEILGETDPNTWHWLLPTRKADFEEQTDFVLLTDQSFQCGISEADLEAAELLSKAHQQAILQAQQCTKETEGYKTRAHGPLPDVVFGDSSATLLKQKTLEERRRDRAEAAARRLASKIEKRKALWASVGYSSLSVFREEIAGEVEARKAVPIVLSNVTASDMSNGDISLQPPAIHYVLGDASEPLTKLDKNGSSEMTYSLPALVCLSLDDSGTWPCGGFFGAITKRSTRPKMAYELAGELDDLQLGDCHLVIVTTSDGVGFEQSSIRTLDDLIRSHKSNSVSLESVGICGLLIAARHTKQSRSSGAPPDLRMDALERSLMSLGRACSLLKRCSVHLPRLGHGTHSFHWYSVERLLHKYLVQGSCVSVYVYYYRDQRIGSASTNVTSQQPVTKKRAPPIFHHGSYPIKRPSGVRHLLNLFSGKRFYLFSGSTDNNASTESPVGVTDAIERLKRLLFAHDGDIQQTLSSDVTHVVVIDSDPAPQMDSLISHTCHVVTPDWVFQCLRQKKCLLEETFRP